MWVCLCHASFCRILRALKFPETWNSTVLVHDGAYVLSPLTLGLSLQRAVDGYSSCCTATVAGPSTQSLRQVTGSSATAITSNVCEHERPDSACDANCVTTVCYE
jgi:hypothetical protein